MVLLLDDVSVDVKLDAKALSSMEMQRETFGLDLGRLGQGLQRYDRSGNMDGNLALAARPALSAHECADLYPITKSSISQP